MSLSEDNLAQEDTAAELSRYGIVRLELPLPHNPGTINSYLLTGQQPVLVDTGLGAPIPLKRLKEALAREGVRPDEIKHVFLTHGHMDHAGAAAGLAQDFGTLVWAHLLEKPRLDGRQADFMAHEAPRLFKRLGVDDMALENAGQALRSAAETYRRMRLDSFEPLWHGQQLPVDGYDLRIIFTPGHSPGSVCFLEQNQKILFTGDTLLSLGTPRPTMSMDGQGRAYFNGFLELQESMAALATVEANLVLPGHGPPARLPDLIARARASLARKQTLLLKKVCQDFTPYDLIRKRDRRTGSAYLAVDLYQTRAILEAFLAEGAVKVEVRHGVEHFSPG
ncbi:MAG: MBL fold metallo-hydrolase [Deltaproteobacteria bacterium]|nr:MBL fold metallo-hydrolase [Deltaproteobacteria bacterium]